MELVRYIHLNPLRAKIVDDLRSLDRYPYTGHSAIIGHYERKWQNIDTVLSRFGKNIKAGRNQYHKFVQKSKLEGKRPELTGGGLIRSAGGWSAVAALRKSGEYFKSGQ